MAATESQISAVIDDYKSGVGLTDIEAKHGVHRYTIYDWLRRADIPLRSGRVRKTNGRGKPLAIGIPTSHSETAQLRSENERLRQIILHMTLQHYGIAPRD